MASGYMSVWLEDSNAVRIVEDDVQAKVTGGKRHCLIMSLGDIEVAMRDLSQPQLDKLARELAAIAGLNVIN